MPRHVSDPGWRVAAFQRATGADAATATGYLESEEWDVQEALVSYRGDQHAAETRPVAECAGACAFAGAGAFA
jgi:hypothetical protein